MDTHEAVCAERYKQITKDIGAIRSTLRWVGTTIVTAFIATAGWGVAQWIHSNRADHDAERAQADAQRTQVQLLQTQITNLTAALKPGTVVVNQNPTAPPAPGPEPGTTALAP